MMIVYLDNERLSIYTLTDPRTGLVMYVGCTERPTLRLNQHRWAPKHKPVRQWIDSLGDLKPVFTVVQRAVGWTSGRRKENALIAHYKSIGQCSLNIVGG